MSADDLEIQAMLRRQAEQQLRLGTAPPVRVAFAGMDALALLHRMATDPESASGALKLLHELQVHQVELDLQQEQLQQSRNELSETLDQYTERYDFAPVGLLTLRLDGEIIDGNLAAEALFGVDSAALHGRLFDTLITPSCRPSLVAMLERLRQGSNKETCLAQASQGDMGACFQLVATVAPSRQYFLVALIDQADCSSSTVPSAIR